MSVVKSFAVGGSILPLDVEKAGNEFLNSHYSVAKMMVGYGMTELGATVCSGRNDIAKLGTVGIPLPKCNVKVVDVETNNELAYGQTGELCFCSPTIMKQYFNNLEETKRIVEYTSDGIHWVHTGDLGYVDEEGFVSVTGRIKRIYTTVSEEGTLYKLFPDYIEKVIRKCKDVEDCAVVCIPDKERKYVAVLYIVAERGDKNVEDEIKKFAVNNLPLYCVPAGICFVDKIPITSIGKIDYLLLEKEQMNS